MAQLINYYYWILFLTLRFLFLFGTGYIHPDEHFQNPQIVAQLIHPHLHSSHWTWEWDRSFPVRSIIGPLLTSGAGFYLFGDLFSSVFGLLFLSRLGSFCWSLVVDFIILYFSHILEQNGGSNLLLLYASSWTTIVLVCRPLMNSFISIIYILSIACVYSIRNKYWYCHPIAFFLGLLVAVGLWSHSSFLMYSIPIGLALLCSTHSGLLLFPAGFSISAFILYLIDSLFYGRGGGLIFPIIFNNILYNSSTENLSQHGLHPLYLHLLLNMFILFGPAYLCFLLNLKTFARYNKPSMVFLLIPLCLHSFIPHQEPRFLLPLSVPLLFLISTSPISKKRTFLATWIIFNVFMCLLFGIFHQRGVIVGLDLASKQHVKQVIGYSVYMPPNYLLPTGVTIVTNPPQEHLSKLECDDPTIVIIPEVIAQQLNVSLKNWKLLETVYHFDSDLLSQMGYTCSIYLSGSSE